VMVLITLVLAAAWWLIRPGVLTIQPIGALPEGSTVIYHSRGPDMPVFASPDSLCLATTGKVSLLCRGAVMAGLVPVTERILLRLPYNRTAYLLSTGGQEFEN
jgi:hypothetical protein